MRTQLKNTRDNSGHSGQACKHWLQRRPESGSQLGTSRDRGAYVIVSNSGRSGVDCVEQPERPMSPAEAPA